MHFRSQKKTAMDVSLSEMIDTGKDGNALSLMEVIRSDEDLFDDLSNRENVWKTTPGTRHMLIRQRKEHYITSLWAWRYATIDTT